MWDSIIYWSEFAGFMLVFGGVAYVISFGLVTMPRRLPLPKLKRTLRRAWRNFASKILEP